MKKLAIFRLLRFLILLAVLSVILELGAVAYYRISSGAFQSNQEILAQEPGSFARQKAQADCSYRDFLFPHPYLGWVHHANQCGWDKISPQGLYGPAVPEKRDPAVFRILLTGGSAAVQFGFTSGDGSLAALLNRDYGNGQRRFEVINAAMEAWKQPQQLFAAILYGSGVDGIVSLEGFNEYFAIVGHSQNGRRMDYPWKESYLATNPFFEQSGASQVASWANQKLYVFTRDHWLGRRSKFALLTTRVTRTRLAAWAERSRRDWSASKTSLDSLFALQSIGEAGAERQNLDLYKRYLHLMQASSAQSGTRLAVFIQPVPARFRTITAGEALVVGDLSYGEAYGEMEAELLAMDDAPVYSLARIYEQFEQSVYTDPIHQEVDGAGYQLMAQRIAGVLGEQWALDGVQDGPSP